MGISFYWLQPPDDGWAVKRRTCNSIKVLDTTHISFSLNGKCQKVKKKTIDFFYAKADGMNSSLDWLNISDYEFLSCCQSRCIRWHLWCWGLMHIDRTSTKSHDMLTTRLCIRGILRFYQLGHRCLLGVSQNKEKRSSNNLLIILSGRSLEQLEQLLRTVAMCTVLSVFDEIDFSDCFPIEGQWKQEVIDNSIIHLC